MDPLIKRKRLLARTTKLKAFATSIESVKLGRWNFHVCRDPQLLERELLFILGRRWSVCRSRIQHNPTPLGLGRERVNRRGRRKYAPSPDPVE